MILLDITKVDMDFPYIKPFDTFYVSLVTHLAKVYKGNKKELEASSPSNIVESRVEYGKVWEDNRIVEAFKLHI